MAPARRFGMLVDTRRCVGCSACSIACRSENDVPLGHTRRWVQQVTRGRFPQLSMQVWSDCCQHCDNPPCVYSCPTGASYVDEATGTTQVAKEKCTGCKACVASCPYDARYVHPQGYIDKCTLCADARSAMAEVETACESVCPTSAIVVGDLDDSSSEIRKRIDSGKVRQQRMAAGTKPRFFLAE